MKKLLMIALLVSACKEHKPAVWIGVDGPVSCREISAQSDIYSCVGGGKAYQCIRSVVSDDNYQWPEYNCARVSAMTVFPEAPSE